MENAEETEVKMSKWRNGRLEQIHILSVCIFNFGKVELSYSAILSARLFLVLDAIIEILWRRGASLVGSRRSRMCQNDRKSCIYFVFRMKKEKRGDQNKASGGNVAPPLEYLKKTLWESRTIMI